MIKVVSNLCENLAKFWGGQSVEMKPQKWLLDFG